MKRHEREVTEKNRICEILQKGKIIHLGLNDDGYPYVVPMHYGFEFIEERLFLYMHGAKVGHKHDLIKANSKAGFEIECEIEPISGGDIPCKYGSYFASIIGKGDIAIVEDINEKIHCLKVFMKNQTGKEFEFNEKMANNVTVLKLNVLSFTAKNNVKKTGS